MKISIDEARRILTECRADHCARRRDELDQCPATIETTLKRLELLMEADLEKRRLLLLGDDDLLSVAIAATDPSIGVTVVDLDIDLLSRIRQLTPGARVETVCHDLRLGLPSELSRRFDIVFTDPPYTLAGQLLFLRRGLTALRPLRGSSLYVCGSRFYLNDSKLASIIEAAHRAGLDLKSTHENFNEYAAPPDVREDLRKAPAPRSVEVLHSTLFSFVVRDDSTSPELLPLSCRDIYSYVEDEPLYD